MTNHYQFNDATFARQFAAGTLDPTLFTHEAHLRLAWIHLKRHGVEQAAEIVSTQILQYTTQLGAQAKFNKTLTVAAVRVVHHFMLKVELPTFPTFIATYPRLLHNFKDLLAQHYDMDIFRSERAKAIYLEPDLLPFD